MAETARQNEKASVVVAAALDAADSAVLVFEAGKGVVLFNPAAVDLFGPPPVGIEGFEEWEQNCGFHTDEASIEAPRHRSTREELPWNAAWRGEAVNRVCYFLRNVQQRSGAWIQVNAAFSSGRVIVSVRNISKRRRAELALKSARRMSRVLFDESRAPIIRTALDGRILACNKTFAKMMGFTNPAETHSFHISDFFEKGSHDALMAELLSKGRILEQPFEFRKKDGSTGSAIANIQMVEPAPGESDWSVITTMVDLSGHRRTEAARLNLETQFQAFMRHFPGVAFIKDKAGTYLYQSDSLRDLPQLSERFQKPDEEVLDTSRTARSTEDLALKDGVHQWTVYRFPISNENGELQWIGGVGVDDSERLKLEGRLQEGQRMEAVGRLAGGVAHDFNNLLTVIGGYGQMLKESVGRRTPHEQLHVYIDELVAATERATVLTDQLLAFGRRQRVRMQRVNLNDQVKSAASLLSRVIGEHIELQVHACPSDCFIRADPGHIGQVIMNLVVNARDAMPAGGRLQIATSLTDYPPDGVAPGRFAVLRVSDTGVGMDSETQLRIFEPFFTSKQKGKGTGLGLSTVYGIVKQIGGEIVVQSEPGVGSVFQIYFRESPEIDEKALPDKTLVPVARKAMTGHETILIVEDDENVRVLVKAMLDRYGYKTLTAEDGKDAIRIFQERGAEVQLLLTDVIMPNMSGRELAVRLQRVAPALKVLYMSGYTADEVASKGVNVRLNILRKPFDAETLAQRVRDVLNQTAPRG